MSCKHNRLCQTVVACNSIGAEPSDADMGMIHLVVEEAQSGIAIDHAGLVCCLEDSAVHDAASRSYMRAIVKSVSL